MNELNFPDKFLKIYQKGEVIFKEGDTGSQMYVMLSGTVTITKLVDGVEKTLTTLGKGEIFGEMALVDHLARSASITALEDNTQLLEIDHALFVYLVGQQPAFALIVLKAMSYRLRSRGIPGIPEKLLDAAPEPVSKPQSAAKSIGVVQLKDNIFQFRGQCMSYLVKGSKRNLLIDTGLPWESDILGVCRS